MFYEILLIMPLLAIVSSLALFICIVVISTSGTHPRAEGFAVHERRNIQRASARWTPVLLPPGRAPRRAVGAGRAGRVSWEYPGVSAPMSAIEG